MPKKNQHKNFVSVEVAIHLEQCGRLIAQLRKLNKLTHADLGVRLGVSQPTERGHSLALIQRFDRMVFNALCGNDDDHTRHWE